MKFEDIKLDQRVYIKKPTRSNYESPSSRRLRWDVAYDLLSKNNQIFTVKVISKETDWKSSEDYCEISLSETNLVCDASWLQPVDQTTTKKASRIATWLSRALDAFDPPYYKDRYEKYDKYVEDKEEPSTKVGFTLKRNSTIIEEKSWGSFWGGPWWH